MLRMNLFRPTLPVPPLQRSRRQVLGLAAAAVWPGLATAQAAGPARDELNFHRLLRQGGCAVLIRHAETEPGLGDPPGFRLGECHTQRNLSLAGREQSRRMGQWFASRKLKPAEVWSSQWCRCRDTAELAFGRFVEWPALNSTFGDASRQPEQTRELRERLGRLAAGQFEVWVTHQVNMTHLTDEYPSMGEAFLVNAKGRVQARMVFG